MTTPRFITPRSSRYGFGPAIVRLADLLGRPFMPWQVMAARLIGETDEAGNVLHPLVIITVPRQSGKTFFMWIVMLHRMLTRPDARIWYTAQLGTKATEQLKEMIVWVQRLAPLRKALSCKKGAGNTSITLDATGSIIKAFPPTGDSLHGNQSDLVVIDEGWYFPEDQAAELMGAITATTNTRPNAQTIIVSTMGTARSTWFHGLVERGRAGDPAVALIDFGIGPGVDPEDFESVYAAHPSADRNNFTFAKLRAARGQLSAGEFARAYGNRPTAAFDRLIPAEVTELATVTTDLPSGAPSFGAAVSFERDSAAIVAAVLDADGVPWCEVVHDDVELPKLPALLASITDRNGGHVVIATDGPAAALADAAEREGAVVTRISTADVAIATADTLDRLRLPIVQPGASPTIRLRAHPALSLALDAATLRTVGDRQVLARRGNAASIAPLEAAILAVHSIYTKPKPLVTPMIWS